MDVSVDSRFEIKKEHAIICGKGTPTIISSNMTIQAMAKQFFPDRTTVDNLAEK